MSVKAISWAFDQPLDPSRKIVLLALADFADDGGRCWPSLDRIAVKCTMSRSTVQRAIADLERFKLLSHEQARDTSSNHQRPNRYTLALCAVGQIEHPGSVGQIDGGPLVKKPDLRWSPSTKKPLEDPSGDPPVVPTKATRQKKPKQFALPGIETLPPWLNREAWQAFREYRAEIGSPLTARGEVVIMGKLAGFAKNDPNLQRRIIDQTIATSRWLDVYALKTDAPRFEQPAERPRRLDYF